MSIIQTVIRYRFSAWTAAAAPALLTLCQAAAAQHVAYAPPMKNTMSLSANFGEVRPNHLHSGVDFRVGGVEGEPVYAVASGYVARIVIRHDGYGNALYVAHPNGTTSVYGHLQRFAPPIAAWAREQQYANRSFFLDVELAPSNFPLGQGALIGFAGNSGSSSGPHLHFEIRDRRQQPLNIMQRGFYKLPDARPPAIRRLFVYGFDTIQGAALPKNTGILHVAQSKSTLRLTAGDTVTVDGACFFGLDMLDKMNGSERAFSVSRCALHLNDSLIFSYTLDAFSFDETRYCNAMIDFARRQRYNEKIIRLYVAAGNRLSIFRQVKQQGVVRLAVGEKAKITIALTDDAGNSSRLAFWVKPAAEVGKKQPAAGAQKIMLWNRSNDYEANGFKVHIPTGALYEATAFEVQTTKPQHGSASPIFRVRQPATPPHVAVRVGVKASVPERLREKALVVCVDKDGDKTALATGFQPPYFVANSRKWGSFYVEIDTIPPKIVPANFADGARLSSAQRYISLTVKDNISELQSYAGYVDDSWALFEYDEKSNLMRYAIDSARVKTGAWHSIIFVATDMAGNKG
ncbi:MAG: M23 family metallopeptidase, partial [Prevotellaceae bacterium]|nr:M23 family metallopeptidase [Prevotellaceae bacterium]